MSKQTKKELQRTLNNALRFGGHSVVDRDGPELLRALEDHFVTRQSGQADTAVSARISGEQGTSGAPQPETRAWARVDGPHFYDGPEFWVNTYPGGRIEFYADAVEAERMLEKPSDPADWAGGRTWHLIPAERATKLVEATVKNSQLDKLAARVTWVEQCNESYEERLETSDKAVDRLRKENVQRCAILEGVIKALRAHGHTQLVTETEQAMRELPCPECGNEDKHMPKCSRNRPGDA